jgi:hypothetical protein
MFHASKDKEDARLTEGGKNKADGVKGGEGSADVHSKCCSFFGPERVYSGQCRQSPAYCCCQVFVSTPVVFLSKKYRAG